VSLFDYQPKYHSPKTPILTTNKHLAHLVSSVNYKQILAISKRQFAQKACVFTQIPQESHLLPSFKLSKNLNSQFKPFPDCNTPKPQPSHKKTPYHHKNSTLANTVAQYTHSWPKLYLGQECIFL